jgi:hypothetical protein
MRKIKLTHHYNIKEILDKQDIIHNYKDWQIIFSIANNKNATAEEISPFIGVKKRKIDDTVSKYNKQ